MPTNSNFAADYIHLGNEGPMGDDKRLTLIAASALSLLCYEEEDEISRILRTDYRFRVTREFDLLSDVWIIPNVADSMLLPTASRRNPSPLLAWSVALQTVFVGFRGTGSLSDIVSDVDIRQSSEPSLASRFHAGFYSRASQYTTLIEQLAKRYRVVVCGHSLGGAMATIATYLALAKNTDLQEMPNAWEDAHNGLSVVTFGCPAAMVVEEQSSTAAPQKCWEKNFHHVINPEDAVPFALGESPKWIEKFLAFATSAVLPPTLRTLLGNLKFWIENLRRGCFAHYGCIYLIERANQITQCRQITALAQIPQCAPDGSRFQDFHSMDHYAYCLGNTVIGEGPMPSTKSETSLTVDQFRQHCWQLPAAIRECSGVVHDNHVTISVTVESRLVQFLTRNIVFKRNGREVAVSSIKFALKPDNHAHMFIKIAYDLGPDHTPAESLAVIHSIRTGLYAYDMFGRATQLPVSEVRNQSLRHASVPSTFESLRLAMIIAFADQIAWVQKLKLSRDAGDGEAVDPTVLTNRAAEVADLVDNIVLSSSPHLVVLQLQHAWDITRSLWPGSQDDAGVHPGGWPKDLNLPDCPQGLQDIITDMLNIFSERGVSSSSTAAQNWEAQGRWKLDELMPKAPSLAATLKKFSHEFYDRPTEPEERIAHAIRQADEVLSSIRFCHLIMLTQLNAPPDWYWEASLIGIFRALSVMSSFSPLVIGALVVESVGLIAGISLLGIPVGAGIGMAFLLYSKRQQPRELLRNFESMVNMTLEVLGVETSPLDSITEMQLARHLQTDIAVSDREETLRRWQTQLAEGLKEHPAISGTCRINPTLFWAQWLFNVARVGKLRTLIASQTRIGVEGPSEAGKSELLTTLTGADPDKFRSGPDANCRTMEIQIYEEAGRDATFVDCPGADDRNPRIREMACLFRNMFSILLFVVPSERMRSEATEKELKEIAVFLSGRDSDLRPVRILLSKADQLPSKRSRNDVFRNSLAESKRTVIHELRRLGSLPEDFVIHSRQARADGALLATETLEDIVHPFSTHAQMSDDGKRALSDCVTDEVRKIEGKNLFHSLHHMAEEGHLWDIESLREWLRGLSPNSVPNSARVWQDE